MDSYQPIYEAVRSRISNGNIGQAVEDAIRNENIGFAFQQAANAIAEQFYGYSRPSVMFRPKISIDGNQWCALYGDNLQDGIAGFGDTPEKAMLNFDNEFVKFDVSTRAGGKHE